MSLTKKEIEDIAVLARLELTSEEKESYREQLSAILAYFEQLQTLDTKDVPPLTQFDSEQNVLRKDEPLPSLEKDKLFKNAQAVEDEQFKTPAVFKTTD
ncbi:MAG: Asp-tRNA(Asn)/Glu-tRNA(Gln) amidotransferase subunit GatC [Chloroflexota bacterium]